MIQNAPFGVFLAMVAVPLAMAAVAVTAGLHARRLAAAVRATKAEPIGMAADGYRQFEGTAEAIGGETLVSPLTGSACVWYSATVEEWKRRPSRKQMDSDWQTVCDLTSTAPVLIRDATGACLVHVLEADVTPRDKSRWTGATLVPEDRNPPRLGPQEALNPMVQSSGGSDSKYRYTEMRIYPGDPLMVVGRFESHRFDASSDPDEPEDESDDETLDDSEDNGSGPVVSADGRQAREAWHAADSERHDTLTRLAASVTKAEIQQGGRGQPLILAATSGATHAYMNEMGAQAAFMVALVPLGLAALVLLARFG